MMGKLISQQAAIDVVAKWIFEVFGIKESDGTATVFKRLRELPSAQPDTTTHDSIPAENGINDGDGTSGDCVSRQQAIEAVGNMLRRKFGIGGDLAEITLACLPSVQPETNCSEIPNNWIPCSERLPEESRKYLVTVFDGICKRTTSAPYHRRSKSWTLTGRMAYWKVTAWMPLPEPYQERGEQDGMEK